MYKHTFCLNSAKCCFCSWAPIVKFAHCQQYKDARLSLLAMGKFYNGTYQHFAELRQMYVYSERATHCTMWVNSVCVMSPWNTVLASRASGCLFGHPEPLRTPKLFRCGISKNLNLKLIIEFFHLLIIPMTLFNDIMPYFDEFIHVYVWNMRILWSPLKIWTPKNLTTGNFRHPVSKSWLRRCREIYTGTQKVVVVQCAAHARRRKYHFGTSRHAGASFREVDSMVTVKLNYSLFRWSIFIWFTSLELPQIILLDI